MDSTWAYQEIFIIRDIMMVSIGRIPKTSQGPKKDRRNVGCSKGKRVFNVSEPDWIGLRKGSAHIASLCIARRWGSSFVLEFIRSYHSLS
jgi:hypothetical protein